jgi:hypothetical protein
MSNYIRYNSYSSNECLIRQWTYQPLCAQTNWKLSQHLPSLGRNLRMSIGHFLHISGIMCVIKLGYIQNEVYFNKYYPKTSYLPPSNKTSSIFFTLIRADEITFSIIFVIHACWNVNKITLLCGKLEFNIMMLSWKHRSLVLKN